MTEKAQNLYDSIVAMAKVNDNSLIIKYLDQLVEELTKQDTSNELIKGTWDALNDLSIR